MGPSPYDRTVAWLRFRFRRRPVASVGLALGCSWIVLNVYEMTVNWSSRTGGLGWFEAATTTVTLCASGVLTLAALVWLVERALADRPSRVP